MKKIIAIIAILATITASQAENYIVQKEAPEFYTTEYFQINYTFFNLLHGVKVPNEKGKMVLKLTAEPYITKKTEILKAELKNGIEAFYKASLDENGELVWTKMTGVQSFIFVETMEGSHYGYFHFETTIDRGVGIPKAKCIVSGRINVYKWDNTRNKFMAGNGGGSVISVNSPKDFKAWGLAFPATNVTPDKVFPLEGDVKVISASYWTGAQIKTMLKSGNK